jgi:aspartate/methionine/tyrosine aminotransferase
LEIETFLLERNQTLYENDVEFNLTESGVHPFTLREMLPEDELQKILDMPLGYGYTDGRPGLRRNVAAWYPTATAENVAVVHGTSEANLLAVLSVLSPGDEVLFLLPNFMQISGLARSFGIDVRYFTLSEEEDWQPNLAKLAEAIGPRTRMIAFANPSNPSGQVFTESSMRGLVELARPQGIYLLSDEIYRGAEIDRPETPTFYGLYDRVIVTSSVSKSFANPGLRLGWMVAPAEIVLEAMRRQDYTSIGTGTIAQYVGEKIMEPELRERVLERSRRVLSENVRVIEDWMSTRGDMFSWRRPQAGGVAFLSYKLQMESVEFSTRLREEESVFVVAGTWFGIDGHIRIGTGGEKEHLVEALQRIEAFVDRHKPEPAAS